MACEACEHCQGPLSHHEVVVREGYSYHHRCHKCYVCSETNLKDAEVFKGVIFCSSCSQRIFQGCSTARHSKAPKPKRTRSKSRHRHERGRPERSHSRHHLQRESGVIELARREHFSNADTPTPPPDSKSSKPISVEMALQVAKEVYHNKTPEMKTESLEMGTTTLFTQQFLVGANPVIEWKKEEETESPLSPDEKNSDVTQPVKPQKRHSLEEGNPIKTNKKTIWSDLRVAELGESTEIANMALRNHSRDTDKMTIKTASPATAPDRGKSILSVLSDAASRECLEEWLDSTYQRSVRRRAQQCKFPYLWAVYKYLTNNSQPFRSSVYRPIRSFVKVPFKYFKTRILDRSSLVSVLAEKEEYKYSILSKIKMLFHEEINDHHRRGVKRLYSTINRRKVPYRLGWLHVETRFPNTYGNLNSRFTPNNSYQNCGRCKHFRRSHSYRCLRAHVMKLAGPTKSQLALIREKIKSFLTLNFLRNIYNSADNESSLGAQSDSSKSTTHTHMEGIATPINISSPRKCSTL